MHYYIASLRLLEFMIRTYSLSPFKNYILPLKEMANKFRNMKYFSVVRFVTTFVLCFNSIIHDLLLLMCMFVLDNETRIVIFRGYKRPKHISVC
jgi:hypothetical protein